MSQKRDDSGETVKSYLLDVIETEQLQRERAEQSEIDAQIGEQEYEPPDVQEE